MLQLYDTLLLGLEAGYCYDCLVWFGTVSLCGVSSFIFVNLNSVLYLCVCIYAVPSPLLMHSQLIELVVRNTRVGGRRCLYLQLDLDVKYATAPPGCLLIYRSGKRFCQFEN